MRTLYSKLAISLVVLLFTVGLFYAILSQVLLEKRQRSSNQILNRELASDLAREMKLVKNGVVDQSTMQAAFHMTMLLNPRIEIYYLGLDGTIVDSATEPSKIERKSIDLKPIREFLDGQSMYPLLGNDPRNATENKSFSVAALPNTQLPVGYLYVVLESSKLDEAFADEGVEGLTQLSFWVLLGSLGMGLPVGLLLFYFLTRRIRLLDAAVSNFRERGYKSRSDQLRLLPQSGSNGDEISQLSLHFNGMAEHIREQYAAKELQDFQRRNMIANVSHDLRTPLSALQGYIERLYHRYESLPDTERKAYLDVALRNSKRLGRLIDDLFELSKLEAKEVEPCFEPFSLSELAQDVLQKFQLRAEERGISLEFTPNSPLPRVLGDIALIDRALSNLVDNAIEHSETGGYIRVRLQVVDDSVLISVEDNGKGISSENIDAIFQCFYQIDANSNSHHAGLGLAITQRILQLHHQEITVKSELDTGSLFQFSMPVCTGN